MHQLAGCSSLDTMKDKEVLKITFSKLYEEIYDEIYDCEEVVEKLHENGLINKKGYHKIKNQQETCEKNRYYDLWLAIDYSLLQFICYPIHP